MADPITYLATAKRPRAMICGAGCAGRKLSRAKRSKYIASFESLLEVGPYMNRFDPFECN
jgi:hypothetical protein